MDDDVFDSVTWETPASEPVRDPYDPNFQPSSAPPSTSTPVASNGPGYRQSMDATGDADASTPKWGGYLLVQVKDPVKELDGTKDVFISYLVEARVSGLVPNILALAYIPPDKPTNFHANQSFCSTKIPRFCLFTRTPCSRLPSLCCSTFARQASPR